MLTLVSFIVIIGILVTIHEAGHYLAAKSVGVHVEKFYIGFNLFGYGWKKEINGTEYGIGWFPLGGYVKVSGMIDESLDSNDFNIPKENQFRYKSMLSKIWIMSAGVIMNFILAIFIFSILIFQNGTYDPDESPILGSILKDTPAEHIGLQANDKIISINNNPVSSWNSMTSLIQNNPNHKILISWMRDNTILSDSILTISDNRIINGNLKEVGIIGISPLMHHRSTNIFEAFFIGTSKVYYLINMMMTTIKLLIIGSISINEMAGPLMIAKVAGETASQGMYALLSLIAFLSVNLGLINILPVPGLDGGHVMIALVEGVYGKELPIKIKMGIQQLGMLLLLILFITIMVNDISRMINL